MEERPVHHEVVEASDDEEKDRAEYEEYRRRYKLWKEEQRQAHMEAEHLKHGYHHHPVPPHYDTEEVVYEEPRHAHRHHDVEVEYEEPHVRRHHGTYYSPYYDEEPRHEDHDTYLSYKQHKFAHRHDYRRPHHRSHHYDVEYEEVEHEAPVVVEEEPIVYHDKPRHHRYHHDRHYSIDYEHGGESHHVEFEDNYRHRKY